VAFVRIAHTKYGGENTFSMPAIDTTGANLIVLMVSHYADSDPPSVGDNKGNTANFVGLVPQIESGVISRERMYYCLNPNVGTGHVFTVTEGAGGSFYGSACVAAFSGAATSAGLDGQAGANDVGVTSIAPPTITPTQPGDLIVSGFGTSGTVSSLAAAGFTISDTTAINAYGNTQSASLAYQEQGAAAPITATWTWTPAARATTTVAAFKAATVSQSGSGEGVFGALAAEGSGYMPLLITGQGVLGALLASGSDTINPILVGEGWLGALSASGTGNAQTPGYLVGAHTKVAAEVTGTTPAIDTSGADLLVANITQYAASVTATFTDSKGNAWTPLPVRAGLGAREQLVYCQGGSINVGTGHTFTLAGGDSFYGSIQVAAFRGSAGGHTAAAGTVATSATSIQPGAVTPSLSGSLVVSGMQQADNSVGTTIGDGFTVLEILTPIAGVTSGGALAYLIQSGPTQPVNPTWSWTGSAWECAASIAVFPAVVSENFVNGSGALGALAATASGGMAMLADGAGVLPSIIAEGIGGMAGDGSGFGLLGPLSASGVIVQPNFITGEGVFGPLGASGTGASTQEIVGRMVIRPAGKAFVLDIADHSLLLHRVPGTVPAPAAFPLIATVTIAGSSYTFQEIDGVDLGDYEDPAGHFTQHCNKVTHPGLPFMTVFFRPDADGSRQEVLFELGRCFSGPAANMAAYTAVISRADGTVLATFNVPRHDWFSRWRWYSVERPARTTAAALMAAGLIPKYDFSLIAGKPPAMQGAATYAPMGLAGQSPDMSTGGGGAEIGPVTTFQAEWIATGNASSYRSMIAQAEAAGTWSFNHRDETTNGPLNAVTYPHASIQSADAATPLLAMISPNHWDTPHQPALNYLPFLLTGDPYYLEGMQFQANSTIFFQPWTFRPTFNVFDAIRAWAWSTRTMACCAKVTPDTVPPWLLPKSYFKANLDGNRDYVMATYVNRGIEPYITHRTFERKFGDGDPTSPEGTYTQPYMEAYCAIVLNWIAAMFPSEPLWMQAAVWKGDQGVKRTNGTSGWNRSIVSPYRQYLRLSTADPWLSWADSWALTASRFGFNPTADPNVMLDTVTFEYPQIWYAAIAPLAGMGVSGADACATWLRGQIQAQNAALTPGAVQHKWCIST